MKNLLLLLSTFVLACVGCNAPSNAVTKETATLTIFFTNDIMGYLTPCG